MERIFYSHENAITISSPLLLSFSLSLFHSSFIRSLAGTAKIY